MWTSIEAAGQWTGEIWNKRKNDEVYPEWLSLGAIRNSKHQIVNYIAQFSDITKRKETEHRIERLAHYDILTRLPNRALFADRLKHALLVAERAGTKVGLMFLDVDKFKVINTPWGVWLETSCCNQSHYACRTVCANQIRFAGKAEMSL